MPTTINVTVPLDLLWLILGRSSELAERYGHVELLAFIRALDIIVETDNASSLEG